MACSAILGCGVMQKTQNVFLGILSILFFAFLFGCINGLSGSYLKMVPMIVTLATQNIEHRYLEFLYAGYQRRRAARRLQ